MNKRRVGTSALIRLIKQRGPVAILGLVFPVIAILVLLPFISFTALTSKQPYEQYNHKKIEAEGVEAPAKIIYMTQLYNVSINGQHPAIISYSYQHNNQTTGDKFETIELEKIADWKVGDEIKVKVLNNESKIVGLEAFSFPYYIFYMLPGIFLIVGVVFFIVGTLPVLKAYKLYQNGSVYEATVVSIDAVKRGVEVNYYFTGTHRDKVFGKSRTDYSVLSEKRPDDKVKIFVSDTNEDNSCLVPKLEALKYNWEL